MTTGMHRVVLMVLCVGVQQASEEGGAAGSHQGAPEGEERRHLGAVHCEGGADRGQRGHEDPGEHPA